MSFLIDSFRFAVAGASAFVGQVAAKLATSPTGLALSSGVTVSMDTEVYDDVSGWASSPNPERFVAPSDGYAMIYWQVRFENSTVNGIQYALVHKNGSALTAPNGITSVILNAGNGGRGVAGVVGPVAVTGGDYFSVFAGATFSGADSFTNDAVWMHVEFYE